MNRLQAAFDAEPVPRDLEAKVRARLENRTFSYLPRLISSLALLVVMAIGLQYYGVSQANLLLAIGVSDHRHCAIEGAYPKQTERAAMITALGPSSVMLQPILDQMPGDAVVSAHRCTVGGRAYVHVIVRRGQSMISVIMTRRKDDEFYPRTFSTAFLRRSSIPIRDAELEGYSVSGFTAGGYLGYVVSALPPAQNRELAAHIAPVIRKYTGV
jgi:hypothetical protein